MIDRAKMASRLDHLVRQTFKTREAAAARLDIPLASLDRYCRGDSDVPATRLGQIARGCDVSADFLIFGDDLSSNVTIEQLQALGAGDGVVMIPLLNVIANAGTGISTPYPTTIDLLPFPKRWLDEFGVPEASVEFLPIHGDSMEPTVRDGAACLVDTRFQTPRIDAIYVLIDDDDVRLKRIGRGMGGSLTLISDNEHYRTETLAPADAAKLRIAGRAFWAGGKI